MIQLPKLEWPREPFRGIEQFRFIDRPIFFERRDETRRLIRLVSIYRGTLLYGESGVGKSSVINAGFIPAMLEEGFLPERLRVQPLRGGELVVERLALTDEGTAPFLPSRFASDEETRTRLVFSTEEFRARLSSEHPGGPPLLIFDQFEEFITLFEEAPEGREKFAEATEAQKTLLDFFHGLLRDETLPVKLLFVFREDYLAKLSKLFTLVPNLRDQHVRLTFPDSTVLKKLIRGPFTLSEIPPEHFGRVISDELADQDVRRAGRAERVRFDQPYRGPDRLPFALARSQGGISFRRHAEPRRSRPASPGRAPHRRARSARDRASRPRGRGAPAFGDQCRHSKYRSRVGSARAFEDLRRHPGRHGKTRADRALGTIAPGPPPAAQRGLFLRYYERIPGAVDPAPARSERRASGDAKVAETCRHRHGA